MRRAVDPSGVLIGARNPGPFARYFLFLVLVVLRRGPCHDLFQRNGEFIGIERPALVDFRTRRCDFVPKFECHYPTPFKRSGAMRHVRFLVQSVPSQPPDRLQCDRWGPNRLDTALRWCSDSGAGPPAYARPVSLRSSRGSGVPRDHVIEGDLYA